ncbi:MAG: hypothetical protein ABR586_01915, partial [Thermoplasmatota archaeon]
SVNRGMDEAPDADAWILLNDDCFMDEGWVEQMLDAVRCHPEAGVVGALLRFPDGRVQHAGGYLTGPLPFLLHNAFANRAPLWALRQLRRLRGHGMAYSGHYHRLDPRHRLGFVTGACLLVTRECRERIGGFDEEYAFGYEDLDYCLRALDAGLELAMATEARGVHLQTATGGGLRDAWARSETVFQSRWGRGRVLELTRRGGRRGIHHGRGPAAACDCPAG